LNYLIDTCVISELSKTKPNAAVEKWFSNIDPKYLYVSVLTLGELQKGVARLPRSSKRIQLEQWIDTSLLTHFEDRILPITAEVARESGNLQARAEKSGQKLPSIDSLLATTAIVHRLTVVTRNVTDLEATGIAILNLWI